MDGFFHNNNDLISALKKAGYIKTLCIEDAFRAIDRKDFIPDSLKDEAYVNAPLPIGFGQTISQPLTVAFMLELLQPEIGNRILDIGSGSGWQTALLAYIVTGGAANGLRLKRGGAVYALELIPELYEFGKANAAKYNYISSGIAHMECRDGSGGFPENAPFDRIIAGAAAEKFPQSLLDQTAVGGRIVVPILHSIWLFKKEDNQRIEKEEYPGFAFVPLISS